MIELTDLNGVEFILNSNQIESIRNIPETKITLTNGNFYLVREDKEEIVDKVIAYNKEIFTKLIRIN